MTLQRLFPYHSDRRMILRLLRETLQAPRTFPSRVNPTNIGNWLRYRTHRFTCPVCGQDERPLYDFPDLDCRREHRIGILRETLQCRHCFASMRQRSLALGILKHLARNGKAPVHSIEDLARQHLLGLAVLDSDNFSAISERLRRCSTYVRSSYIPSRPWGQEIAPGYLNLDLQKLTLPDALFDLVLTSDVMEHVRDSDAAHREIFRVLKPGGAYVFNVPYLEDAAHDIQLVDTTTDQDVFLCPPHYHGDPLSGGVLAYRVFGRDLVDKLRLNGF